MADDEKQAGKKDHVEVLSLRKKERPRGHLDFGVAFSVMKRKSGDEKKPPSTMSDIQPQGGKKTV